MPRRRFLDTSLIAASLASVVLSGCSGDGRTMRAPSPDQVQSIAVATTSSTVEQEASFAMSTPWTNGDRIDDRYTCRGQSISPRIEFLNVPADIVTIGLVMIDETAGGEVLWAVANVDPASPVINEGSIPTGAISGLLTDGTTGYKAPCPSATHTFQVIGYALSQQVELATGADAQTIVDTLEAAALEVVTSSFVSP